MSSPRWLMINSVKYVRCDELWSDLHSSDEEGDTDDDDLSDISTPSPREEFEPDGELWQVIKTLSFEDMVQYIMGS